MIETEKYKNHSIMIRNGNYSIFWIRGKEFFDFDVTEKLAEKSRRSDKDALEVMFYLENKRWPEEGELENYNKTDVKTYVGDGFTIYEENGEYEIRIEKDHGGPVFYPITKELKEKALKSPRDGYEVAIYAETGGWPPKDPEENSRKFIRKHPKLILINPEKMQKIFSKEEYEHLVKIAKEEQEKEKAEEREKEEIRENPELILWVSEKKRNMFSEEEINRLEVLAKEKIKVRKKKIRKRYGIFIAIIAILIGSFYSYYKVNNRNAFEEMYNSYYNILPLRTIANMPQIVPLTRHQTEQSIRALNYKTNTDKDKVEISLVNNLDRKSISIISSSYISEDLYLDINYRYEVDTRKLINYVSFRGRNIPSTDDKQKQRKELLEKYNISKEYLQEKSDKLLDTVLTDWKRYSNSSYSKDNMGKLTIEKDEFLS
ncbi:TipC family immunity protein [Gemella sanguinis]|uniref:TipC family immunity protein n=1 Tax=Gemella sanguinis TaxID=84135 RepID=UPI00352F3BD6